MAIESLANHLERPLARGHTPVDAFTGAAGGAACGDLIRVSLALDGDDPTGAIVDAGFDASGCGASIAAGSAVVSLIRGAPLLTAACVGVEEIAEELGGLSAAKRHAAELAADALHRALGAAARTRAALAPVPGRTLVAMSGGVDSAVAALLVVGEGEQAVGVTLELWSDPENDGELSCCSAQAVRGARELAHRMGMPHLSIDLRAEFRAGVVEPWLADHARGLTPNPCVRCNGSVRLDAMLELADSLGAQALATGHYARVHIDERDEDSLRAGPVLRAAVDETKDQSYMLAALAPTSLARLRFPLGGLRKTEVRAHAERAGLSVARKPDSQDLCFLAGTGRARFLAHHGGLQQRPGAILDRSGAQRGVHPGHHGYTVGQRRGLGIGGTGDPLYVLSTDAAANTVTVGTREQLRTSTVEVRDVVLHRPGASVDHVRLRYRGRAQPCRAPAALDAGAHARVRLELLEPTARAAPGQLACLMSGELLVGHGTVAV
ncbi:MAG TPA: tRNA 2-thiouridine(34) synthase MnmA [Solirubrobacteraceae bacterium]|nr:tRNA 2-thiouridine(34) synthase MnmA [Solirubrobacteraceae bacterium]